MHKLASVCNRKKAGRCLSSASCRDWSSVFLSSRRRAMLCKTRRDLETSIELHKFDHSFPLCESGRYCNLPSCPECLHQVLFGTCLYLPRRQGRKREYTWIMNIMRFQIYKETYCTSKPSLFASVSGAPLTNSSGAWMMWVFKMLNYHTNKDQPPRVWVE